MVNISRKPFCKTLLVERINLEDKMMNMCPRFVLFLAISTFLGKSVEWELEVHSSVLLMESGP